MHATLDETVASVRRIAADLRPLMLDDLGLPDAAAWLVEEFEKRSGMHCHWKLDNPGGTEEFDSGTANAVYRALQESLTNIARHSGAGNVWVRLEVGPEALRLEVEDDGRGVSAQDLAKTQSLGLKGMRERIHHIGGALEISNPPRGGTRVSLRVPLPEKGVA
jgi:signal transduction histidine kinase